MAQPVKQNALVAAKAAAAKQPVKAQPVAQKASGTQANQLNQFYQNKLDAVQQQHDRPYVPLGGAAPVGNPLVNAFAQALHTLSQKIAQAPQQVQQALQGHPFIQTLGNAGLQLTSGGLMPTSTAGVAGAAIGGKLGSVLAHPVSPSASLGMGVGPGVVSAGGSFQAPIGPQVGGAMGIDNGSPFGSVNFNHNTVGAFGPQGPIPTQPAQNVYTKTNWDVSKLQPGQGFNFEDGSAVYRGPSGLIKTPAPKAAVLGAATRRGTAKPAVRPPAVKSQQTTYAPYGEWKNTRGYDVLTKKGLL